MNEYFNHLINEAHMRIFSHDLPVLNEAIAIVSSIEIRVHDPSIKSKIKHKTEQIDKDYSLKESEIKTKINDSNKQVDKIRELKQWKLRELISFYDNLNHQHELL